MKIKNCRKLILPTIMAALVASIPATSNAYTSYKNMYNVAGTTYSTNVTVKSNSGYYTIINSPNQKTNTTSKKYYVVSRGEYSRQQSNTTKPVDIPVNNTTQPVENTSNNLPAKPEYSKPEQAPTPNTNTGSNAEVASNGKHSLSADEIKLVEYVNKARQDAGLQPLQIDVDLAYVAKLKSQDMYDNKYFSHDSPTYGSPFDMMTKFGIKYRGAAENIAKTSSVESAHNGFMRSQGHKENILNPIYTHIGIGIHNGYYTEMFIRK